MFLCGSVLFYAIPITAQKQNENNSPKQRSGLSVLFDRIAPSVFVVENLDQGGNVTALGSGVCVAPGQVVTNHHVVKGSGSLRVRQADSVWSARIVDSDVDHDL